MRLTDLIPRDAIVPRLVATDPEGALRELAAALVTSGALSAETGDALLRGATERERSDTTGFGKGVAVPHARLSGVEAPAAALGVSEAGLDFRARDGRPVHLVILLASPAEPERHLAAMNALWPALGDARFRQAARAATTREAVKLLLDAVAAA